METEKIKRSKGITIFAWVILIISAITAPTLLDVKTIFDGYKHLPHTVAVGCYWFGVISTIIGFVATIGILRLKEAMRKIAISINILDALYGILFFFQLKGLKQSIYEMVVAKGMLQKQLPNTFDDIAAQTFVVTVFSAAAGVIFKLLFIWYFTRTNIKEQFK